MQGFIRKGGIYVPKRAPAPILIFIDETFLHDRSAFIRAAVPFTHQAYWDLVVPKGHELLKRLGPQAKEFKGSKLSKWNRAVYEEFLERVTSVEGAFAEKGVPLRAVVSVDAAAQYSGSNFRTINAAAKIALEKVGINQVPACVDEFCRQMLWLQNHLPKIILQRISNGLVIGFDNQHRFAQELLDPKAIGTGNQPRTLVPLGNVLTLCANTLLKRFLRPTTGPVDVKKFDFLYSHKSFGIQAADLLANLTYNALRYEHGFTDPTTKLKRDILYEFVPEAITCERLKSALRSDGKNLTCVDEKLILTMQINPIV